MSDTNRRRHYEDLRGILAQQLSAAADEWAPVRRRPVHTMESVEPDRTPDPLMEEVDGQELSVDDVNAVLKRSFDYEAAEWLLRCLAVTTVREIH